MEGKLYTAVFVGIVLYVCFKLLFPMFLSSPPASTRLEAGIWVRTIVTALKAYQNDYGHFPEIGTPLPTARG